MPQISIVLGTGRAHRESEKVARMLFEESSKYTTHISTYVDIRECLATPFTMRHDEVTGKDNVWYKNATHSTGFIFVLPEYNHGYPGEWKLLMDSLYKNAYLGKTVALVGVSSGQFGGVRAIEQAILTLSNRGMYVIKDALHFPFVETQFDSEGSLVHDEQKIRVQKFLTLFYETVSKYT